MDNTINEDKKWTKLSSEYLVKRPWLTARKDVVQLPDGRVNPEYYVLEYPDWVNIIAITKDGKMVMERQYRYGIGKTCYELPCGVIEKGENPLEAARRELLEETGYSGGIWQEWMILSPNPSTSNNFTHSFLATGVEKVSGQHLDPTEDIDVFILEQDYVEELLLGNQILQALMTAPLWKFFYGPKVSNEGKAHTYSRLIPQIESLVGDIDDRTAALANVSALLHSSFPYYFWCGFYIAKDNRLELGPFQGEVACYTIPKGKGVCGKAWEEERTIVVDDVLIFPGHIACSSKSRSEIVVPVFKGGTIAAVIDVDSTDYGAFDDGDKEGLEKIADIVSRLF